MMNLDKMFIVLLICVIGSCKSDSEKSNKNISEDFLEESQTINSDNYMYTAILTGKVKTDTLLLEIEIYKNDDEVVYQLQRTDSLLEIQNRRKDVDTLYLVDINEPLELGDPIRHLVINFIESFKDEEKPLFEGIYLDSKARKLHIPQKRLIVEY